MAKKKVAKKPPRKRSGVTAKQLANLRPPFEKGHNVGEETRFKKGWKGGPGRPPGSVRKQIKYWAEQELTETMKEQIAKLMPRIPKEQIDNLSIDSAVALKLVFKALEGDVLAIREVTKQIDDAGADRVQHEFDQQAADAADAFASELSKLVAKAEKRKSAKEALN